MAMYPSKGIPQLYFVQLNVITNHLHQIKHGEKLVVQQLLTLDNLLDSSPPNEQPQKFTRKQLHQCDDWLEWKQREHKQLDQYSNQDMFDTPEPLPKEANLLPLVWVYVQKPDGS